MNFSVKEQQMQNRNGFNYRDISRVLAAALLFAFVLSGNPAMAREKPMDIIFNLADADQNGLISETEWHTAMQKRLEAIDINHDGNISREELESAKEGFRNKMRSSPR